MIINSIEFFQTRPDSDFLPDSAIILAAWEVKNPENIGHIIRLGHNVGAQKVLFISDENQYRESKIKKIAGFSFHQQNWKFVSEEQFFTEWDETYTFSVLETCEGSENIYKCNLPKKMVLLAGNESHGIPAECIQKSKVKVHIPMPGACKSMNVSHALSVATFEWFRKSAVFNV